MWWRAHDSAAFRELPGAVKVLESTEVNGAAEPNGANNGLEDDDPLAGIKFDRS